MMDPEKRFTCAQLLQHPYFDGFTNEFDREKKELIKSTLREQNKLLMQQQQQQQAQPVKPPTNVFATGQTKGPNQGVSRARRRRRETPPSRCSPEEPTCSLFSAFTVVFSQSRSR